MESGWYAAIIRLRIKQFSCQSWHRIQSWVLLFSLLLSPPETSKQNTLCILFHVDLSSQLPVRKSSSLWIHACFRMYGIMLTCVWATLVSMHAYKCIYACMIIWVQRVTGQWGIKVWMLGDGDGSAVWGMGVNRTGVEGGAYDTGMSNNSIFKSFPPALWGPATSTSQVKMMWQAQINSCSKGFHHVSIFHNHAGRIQLLDSCCKIIYCEQTKGEPTHWTIQKLNLKNTTRTKSTRNWVCNSWMGITLNPHSALPTVWHML